MSKKNNYMEMAIEEAYEGMRQRHGGPFGAIIVKDNKVISRGHNCVLLSNDCTAHAEIEAIRKACRQLNSFDLSGCEMYVNGLPCPMCLGAICWSRIERTYYACVPEDAQEIGFDDAYFYEEFYKLPYERSRPLIHLTEMHDKAKACYQSWLKLEDRIPY